MIYFRVFLDLVDQKESLDLRLVKVIGNLAEGCFLFRSKCF